MSRPLSRQDLDHVLEHTRDDWEALRGASLLVTGGTGFFGKWLLETFLDANRRLGLGASLTVLTRDPEGFEQSFPHLVEKPTVTLFQGDVRSFDPPPGRFTHGIHAATEASAKLNAEDGLRMFGTIVEGTRRFLDVAVERRIGSVLLTSSGAVYGPQPSGLTHTPEDHPGGPNPLESGNAYAEGKRAAETLSALYAKQHGLDVRIARCWAFVGPHLPLDAHFAVGNFLRDALGGGPIRVGGDGTPYRSYLHAADLAVWLWRILVRGTPGRPYNVGSDEALTIAQLADQIAASVPGAGPVVVARQPVPGASASRYVPAVDRARAELGLDVRIPLGDAMRRTIAWLQEA